MHGFLVNLIIGIIGGIYSSIIVSRVFLLREELEEQLNILRKKTYYFGSLTAFFDVIEMIKKLQSDTSHEIEEGINRSSDYLDSHDIVHASDIINTMKVEILDKTIDKICNDGENPLALKQNEFIELKKETIGIVSKYKKIKQFKFETIDDSKKEIIELEKKYEACISKRYKYLFGEIIKDPVILVLCAVFAVLCILILFI